MEHIQMQEPFDLAKILWPVEPEAFFRDTWEQKPLAVQRHDPDYYRDLFGLRDVDQVVAFTRPKFIYPADFRGGAGGRRFVQGWLADDEPAATVLYPDVAELQQAFLRGKTVIINAMQHRWPPIADTCRRLDTVFGCLVHANLYLTPKGAQGFDPHHDGHEVFVLQLEGSKHWRFYGKARDLPLPDEDGPVPRDGLGLPTQEMTVQPGDLLYMPRGHVHEAFTSDRLSMHLTLGVKVFRWVDLLKQALDDYCRQDVRLRQSLPCGLLSGSAAPEGGAELAERFRELARAFAEGGRVEGAVERLSAQLVNRLAPLPADFFTAADEAERLEPDTVVERAPGVVCRVVEGPDWAGIEYPGNRVDGPGKIAAALHFVARTPRFAVRELPDDLPTDGKVILVGRLIRARFLVVARTHNEGPVHVSAGPGKGEEARTRQQL
jgi:hypothetical protein